MASMAQATKTEGALTYGRPTPTFVVHCYFFLFISLFLCSSVLLLLPLPISLSVYLLFHSLSVSVSLPLPPSSFLLPPTLSLSHTHSFHFSNFLCPKLNGAIEAPCKLKIYALGIDLIHLAPRVSHVHHTVFP